MKGRITRDEDSGSDWDSMSEAEPPKMPVRQGQPAAVPRKMEPVTLVNAKVGKKVGGENPPYDFTPETTSSTKEEVPSKPGKPRKGNLYDPNEGIRQKRVSFAEDSGSSKEKTLANGSMAATDSDSEDPLYSKVNRKLAAPRRLSPINDNGVEEQSENGNAGEKRLKHLPKHKANALQGVENKGYIDDEESLPALKKSTKFKERNKNLPTEKAASHQDGPNALQGNTAFFRNEPHTVPRAVSITDGENSEKPLILTLGQSAVESAGKKPVEVMNKIIGEACTFITFPFYFFSILLHHLIKFFLQGVVKPIIVDSLVLVVEYLIRPFMGLVVKPVLYSLHGASLALSDIILVCVKPLTSVLQSFRLVEINYTRKYSIEEI